ncbi:hypothetical protein CB0940_09027 [Cercospora beticola]|uniref:Uncharacterized protein n=1 Tax=Cercospora beticola TaxID=122368 RepID=A0A2G5HGA0_CERBT|nr:hypothetical protein CB0940_09027 [Cercospora beticola]PIA91616.1 hypothetical protein CB0940_09027 [Cercospora beticola]WPB06698.1 hypothetical protein RHO25_011357 [Cercospora beticola]CAK1366613.1 unnamed protein product [Cercospora beticola]
MSAAVRDTESNLSEPDPRPGLGHCIAISIIIFVAGLLLPLAFSFSSTIKQVAYCDLCKPQPGDSDQEYTEEIRKAGWRIRKVLFSAYIIGCSAIFAVTFTQTPDLDTYSRALKASVGAFVGTMMTEVIIAFGVCIVVKHRHVLEVGKACRRTPHDSVETFERVDSGRAVQ